MGRYDKNRESRTRNYATVIYDENCIDKLRDLHVPCLISPWHDKDINPTGEVKKAHRHVLINFDSVKTKKQAKDLIEEIGGVGCEVVLSNRAYARYLCHLDNPEKAQYDINDVLTIGGLDYIELINSCADELATLYDIVDYILNNNITNCRQFLTYCRTEQPEWFSCIFRHRHLYEVKEVIMCNVIDND